MRYLCLIRVDQRVLDALPAHQLGALNAAHHAYNDELRKAGHFIAAEALEPAAFTTSVRVRHGKPSIVDGPFAETKEQLCGSITLDGATLDDAVAWAERCPATIYGTVEVRPVMPD